MNSGFLRRTNETVEFAQNILEKVYKKNPSAVSNSEEKNEYFDSLTLQQAVSLTILSSAHRQA